MSRFVRRPEYDLPSCTGCGDHGAATCAWRNTVTGRLLYAPAEWHPVEPDRNQIELPLESFNLTPEPRRLVPYGPF